MKKSDLKNIIKEVIITESKKDKVLQYAKKYYRNQKDIDNIMKKFDEANRIWPNVAPKELFNIMMTI